MAERFHPSLGGPSSPTVLYTVGKFRQQNPKTYRAFLAALNDAATIVNKDPEAAADIFIKANGGKGDRQLVLDVIRNPRV